MSSKQPPTKTKTMLSPGRPTKVGIDPRPPGALPAPPRPPSVFPAAGSAAYLPSLSSAGNDSEPVKPDQNATPPVESPTETLEELKSEFDRLPMLHDGDSVSEAGKDPRATAILPIVGGELPRSRPTEPVLVSGDGRPLPLPGSDAGTSSSGSPWPEPKKLVVKDPRATAIFAVGKDPDNLLASEPKLAEAFRDSRATAILPAVDFPGNDAGGTSSRDSQRGNASGIMPAPGGPFRDPRSTSGLNPAAGGPFRDQRATAILGVEANGGREPRPSSAVLVSGNGNPRATAIFPAVRPSGRDPRASSVLAVPGMGGTGKDPRASSVLAVPGMGGTGKDPRASASVPGIGKPPPQPMSTRTKKIIRVGVMFLAAVVVANGIYFLLAMRHDAEEQANAERKAEANTAERVKIAQLEAEIKELKQSLSTEHTRIKKLETDFYSLSSAVNTFNQRNLMNSH